MKDKGFMISVYELVEYDVEKVKVTENAQLPLFKTYKYPYDSKDPMYYFNNKYIFAFIDSKQAKRSYNDRNLLKQYVDNKTYFKKILENYLKEDEKKLQNNEYFVRINNGKNLIGKISKYFTPGEHDRTGLVGSMVMHPDCEVKLTFKKFKVINKKKIRLEYRIQIRNRI